jgi:predicted dehydrogenase
VSRALNIAIVGCGYWGVNYLRVFSELPDCKVSLVCDTSEDRLRTIRERFPLVSTTNQLSEVFSSRWVDAVVIATPAATHFELSSQCLAAGKHILVEKPITTSIPEAAKLIRDAQQARLVLMVGHTFMYNSGILKIKELMTAPDFGQVYYLHATRTNMGPVRSDVNALWDLGTHDVAIFNFLLDAAPTSVSAVASKVLGKGREDVGFVSLRYPNNVLANIHASWIDPNKVREVVVVGSRRRIVFDDLNNLERVRIYEKGMSATMEADTFGEFRLIVRDGDIISPRVPPSEPLKNLAMHFLSCVAGSEPPLSDGRNGLDVVRVMAAIDRSLAQEGAPVDVPPGDLA